MSNYNLLLISGQPTNPEEVQGIKEAISILENQDSKPSQSNVANTVQIVTPQPVIVDERNNKNVELSSPSPIYRSNRHFNASNSNVKRNVPQPKTQEQSSSEFRLITVGADINFNNSSEVSSAEKTRTSSAERKHRRRMTQKITSTTTSTTTTTTTSKPLTSTPSVEIVKQEIQPIEHFTAPEVKQETLTDQLDPPHKYASFLVEALKSPPVKRFYRSSAEKDSKEMTIVNNEKVQIVRPTSMARLVGQYQSPVATIAKLDEAVLGTRTKKSAVTIVTPEIHKDHRNPTNDQT